MDATGISIFPRHPFFCSSLPGFVALPSCGAEFPVAQQVLKKAQSSNAHGIRFLTDAEAAQLLQIHERRRRANWCSWIGGGSFLRYPTANIQNMWKIHENPWGNHRKMIPQFWVFHIKLFVCSRVHFLVGTVQVDPQIAQLVSELLCYIMLYSCSNGSVSKPCTPGEHQNSW